MIGIDIADIKRFKKIKQEDFSLWEKVFTDSEWEYCFNKPNPSQHLAGIFASKEAVMKAVGSDIMKRYDLIEVTHDGNGKPNVVLKTKEIHKLEISISHDGGLAIAVAIKIK
ncbi:MAG: holo-ACP synthase [Candidatus Pacebacteria bacterium]|jgi:holo-[acyl-carrier protein] synthase|nr:holo-[acyl-carrier-protein] synthase [Parcubacteria group bacterium]MDP7367718.1 holo-ACP synthase [Candidatus Paceibacterota bacterium]MDP7466462.1 holo-ACP synthase [Candidatus Paceibacterota bacterium]|tara:strand:+ start:2952 stop:3287 length:336 start_codon:yes stop_codon:yes gene_type:complete